MNIKEIIIIGGGLSIDEGISLGLKEYLKNKFVIACNYAFLDFPHTFMTCCDWKFYQTPNPAEHPDISKELIKEPLIISGMILKDYVNIFPNTIVLKRNDNYSDNPLTEGFISNLTGIFSLQVSTLFKPDNIFILGFDWTKRPDSEINKNNYNGRTNLDIHYYKKNIQHYGSGYVGYYETHNPNFRFKHFTQQKIYNVNPNSNIDNFEKITYKKMFELLSPEQYNQEELRQFVKTLLSH